ncbi:hypothetical protein EDC01DRAFT_666902 [Geopyxis carbonaria]|nr:hypothetical protein EDC01DRAFT_666902 [Geopyxis carbonaria]
MHFPTTISLLTLAMSVTAASSAAYPASKPFLHRLTGVNTAESAPKSFPYSLQIPPNTDLWSKPPALFSHSQPSFVSPPIPLHRLASAAVTLRLTPEVLYDQAGIVLLYGRPGDRQQWIKAGVENVPELGGLKKSCVATPAKGWSDWSAVGTVPAGSEVKVKITREMEVGEEGKKGPGVVVEINGERVREVMWGFFEEEKEVVRVGFYGARPALEGTLEAVVEGWEVRVWEDEEEEYKKE